MTKEQGTDAKAKARTPLRLVAVDAVSRDTIECLRELLAEAERGEVVGVAYVAMHRQRGQYTPDLCGEAARHPTYVRGMVAALDDKLAKRVWGED